MGTRPASAGLTRRSQRRGVARVIAMLVVLAGALFLGASAQARLAAGLTLDVTFAPTGYSGDGTVTVSLPDGSPVGTTSGAPTVIPAGFYTVLLTGPGGCVQEPYFQLQGPGVSIVNNLTDGTIQSLGLVVDLLPNSTYTWSNQSMPGLVYSFTTSGTVGALAPPPTPAGSSTPLGNSYSSSSSDLVGSAAASSIAPFRGSLSALVSAAGKLSLDFKGKSVALLSAGRYTVSLTDRDRKDGFVLEGQGRPALTLAEAGFVGTDKIAVELTSGQWSFASRASGPKSYFVVAG